MFENNKLQLGQFLGFTIQIHYSWFLIAGMLTVALGTGVVAGSIEGRSQLFYLGMGLAETLVLYLCLLAHELGHSLMGRKLGLPVDTITLFILGGVAEFRVGSRRAKDELLVTAAGPAVSILCGLLFSAFAVGGLWMGWEVIGTLVILQAGLNFLLALFNLLPVFPLDGGRILRAVLWKIRDDKLGATRWATGMSGVVGASIVGLAVLYTGSSFYQHGLGSNIMFDGLWGMLLGGFVMIASRSEYAHGQLEETLSTFSVKEVMKTHILPIQPHDLALEAITKRGTTGPWVVAENGEVKGVFDLDNLQEQIEGNPDEDFQAQKIMKPVWREDMFSPEQTAEQVFWHMEARDQAWGLVGRRGQLDGVVSKRSLIERARQKAGPNHMF